MPVHERLVGRLAGFADK